MDGNVKMSMQEFWHLLRPLNLPGVAVFNALWHEYVRCETQEQYEWFIRGLLRRLAEA